MHQYNKIILKFGFPLFKKIDRISLPDVTLLIIDCVNYQRAKRAFDHCRFYCDFGAAKILTSIPTQDKDVTTIPKINSIDAYSHFMLKDLANYFTTKHVIIAQWDGFVWKSQEWDPVFLNYDYIGAPWPEYLINDPTLKHCVVGNGGFSLRSKKLQTFLSHDDSIQAHNNEDVIICQTQRAYLEKAGFVFAPIDIALKFSNERYLFSAFGQHSRNGLNMPIRPLWICIYNLIHHGKFVSKIL